MRILFDPAVYDMRNKGNVALLQAALRRVHDLWPDAALEVMTDSPHLLRLYCPEAFPVSVYGHYNWARDRHSFERLHSLVPNLAFRAVLEVREEVKYRRLLSRRATRRLNALAAGSSSTESGDGQAEGAGASAPEAELSDPPDLQQAMLGADMVIATGGGYLVDSDWGGAHPVLLRLAKARRLGKFTALVGQGVGRIDMPDARALASRVLPTVDLILVREHRFAIPFLESLGVSPERLLMSGDDAVEMAYEARRATLGSDIGVSVRLAHYTDVAHEDLGRLRAPLHQAATRLRARLVGVPTSCCGVESDQFPIRELLAGYPKTELSWARFEPTLHLIKTVGKCRVMVAGAFHAAVFALAQGIPTIGLVRTREYSIKFGGLVDQFGAGCRLLALDDERLEERLAAAIGEAWDSAERLRPALLEAAAGQVRLGRLGYRHLYELYQASCLRH